MAEHPGKSSETYSLKKVYDCWILENSKTLQTNRLPFLSNKHVETLKDNFIFADDKVYKIKENDSGGTCIEKVEDLIYSAPPAKGAAPSTWPLRSGIAKRDALSVHALNEVYMAFATSTDSMISHDKGPVNCYMEEVNGVFRSIRDVKASSTVYDNAETGTGTDQSVGTGGPKQQFVSHKEHIIKPPQVPVTRQVTIEDTKLSELCNLKGTMELRVDESGLSFHDTKTKSATYTFSNRWIRNFGFNATSKDSMFYIEVGRNCPNGEGNIKFSTEGKAKLHQSIRHRWHNQDK